MANPRPTPPPQKPSEPGQYKADPSAKGRPIPRDSADNPEQDRA